VLVVEGGPSHRTHTNKSAGGSGISAAPSLRSSTSTPRPVTSGVLPLGQMAAFQDELAFLKDGDYATAYSRNPKRVLDCLVHSSVDMRIAAVKAAVANGDDSVIRRLITLFADHAAWQEDGLTPSSRLIAPKIGDSHGALLAECFPRLALRNLYCFQLLCHHCNSPILRDEIQGVLFDENSECEICQLAIKCLVVYGFDQTTIWNRCLGHRCQSVARSAKHYLEFHAESAE